MTFSQLPSPRWYRQPAGRIFLGMLVVGIIGLTGFGALTGYYLWQIKEGKQPAVAVVQSGGITLDQSRVSQAAVTGKKITDVIRPHNPTLGSQTAPVTIVAFIDFECPYCRSAYPIFSKVVAKYGDAVRVVFKNFPITSLHPNSYPAALAAACAAEQGHFWEYYQALFQQTSLEKETLMARAQEVALDLPRFRTCFDTERYRSAIDDDLKDVVAFGVRGTPTYFINATKLEGVASQETWDKVILQELNRR